MPRLPSRTPKEVIKILKRHGFIRDSVTGSHYTFINEGRTRRVTVPFHARDIPRGTLHEILKQAGLRIEEL